MGKSTISMAIFNSYATNYQRVYMVIKIQQYIYIYDYIWLCNWLYIYMVIKKYGWWFWLWIKIWINKMKCFFGANVVFKSGVRSTCSVANEAKLAGEVGAFGVEEELSICMSIYVHVAQLSWLAIQSAWSVLAGHLEVISSTDVGLNRFRPQFFSARPFCLCPGSLV